ncbi:MAG: tRNA uridine-5-carboxymethylaminomethyl(34) synthesis GTPase MnmE [Rhizobiaceae bacterium]
MQSVDTIFALSSGALPSGVAVVRLSGPHTKKALRHLLGKLPAPRGAVYASIRNRKGLILDRGLALLFPEPASFTGEDCAELHLHGGRAVVAAVLAELSGMDGLRHAEAGEFTKRAFLNGKLDLLQAEALADLIEAETEAQRRFAVSNAGGFQSQLYEAWRGRLLHARAMIEAELDFADESDVPGSVSDVVWADMASLRAEIGRHIDDFHKAEMIRDGFRVAILGAPNAGKSSLLNSLVRRDAAIVTDEPGTTRDVIEVALDLNGYKVLIADTAGIRNEAETVEAIGIDRAIRAGQAADLALVLIEPGGCRPQLELSSEQVIVRSKADLGNEAQDGELALSTVSGFGLDRLLDLIASKAEAAARVTGAIPSHLRHVELLAHGRDAIEAALAGEELELKAEELRRASDQLGRISGRIDPEELLGAVFSSFCIGK